MTNRTESARDAFSKGDVETSKEIHRALTAVAKEKHVGGPGEYVESIVFGGLDGIVTTYAVIVAAAASMQTRGIILILGLANLLGDAMGMAIGDWLSSKAEGDHEESERKREEWEVENCPELEKQEMVEIYVKKGLPEHEAREVVDLLFTSKEAFLDVMLIQELGIMPEGGDSSPLKSAAITFVSFFIFGGLPMVPYLASGKYDVKGLDWVFYSSIGVFAIALFALGAVKGKITNSRWWVSGFTMLFTGGVTTAIAYLIGWALDNTKIFNH
eukprot:TRINITY_DN6466_c0_g1_i1.p1 TRINITY_DN6466_c0_g1~~TRINITY_DN6466_c0_g1_i1.p1  ORF type:complete len:271 (-),score=83.87 TRINITY_DN6466_c0_g1_i1:269-1081(-)